MRTFAVIAALLAASISVTEAAVGRGACPTLTSVAWDQTMAVPDIFFVKYVDKLINSGYTLYNLVLNKQYITMDCVGINLAKMDGMHLDLATFNALNTEIAKYKVPAGITYWDTTNSVGIFQGCVDASGLVTILGFIGNIPDWATTIINIATYLMKFVHFQLNIVFNGAEAALDPSVVTSLTTRLTDPTNKAAIKMSSVIQLKTDASSCPTGLQFGQEDN
jgi:hypothetical protein